MTTSSRTHITTADLDGACAKQVEVFVDVFDGRAEITVRNMVLAIKAGLDVSWLAVLIPAHARAKYDADRAPIWAKYRADHAPIWAKYDADYATILVAALVAVSP